MTVSDNLDHLRDVVPAQPAPRLPSPFQIGDDVKLPGCVKGVQFIDGQIAYVVQLTDGSTLLLDSINVARASNVI